jgi:hypothetical protein
MNDLQQIPADFHEGMAYPSPVTRMLALGYYDGPTEGVLYCGTNGPAYAFQILAWEQEMQDLRVFALAPFPLSAWSRLIEAYSLLETPRWPVWLPSWHEEMDQPTEVLLREAGPPQWVLATYDLLGEILVAKPVTPDVLAQVGDWRQFLGLSRELPNRVLVPVPDFSDGA